MYTPEDADEFLRQQTREWEQLQHAVQARREAEAQRKKAEALALIEQRKKVFAAHAASFTPEADALLVSQAKMLHGIFAHALDEYVGAGEEGNKVKLYGAIALRAQNYCRMTLSAAGKAKEQKKHATETGEITKIEKPPIIRSGNEALDTGGASPAGGTDPALAAMENPAAQDGVLPGGEPV